jgi:hypothetical protein
MVVNDLVENEVSVERTADIMDKGASIGTR